MNWMHVLDDGTRMLALTAIISRIPGARDERGGEH